MCECMYTHSTDVLLPSHKKFPRTCFFLEDIHSRNSSPPIPMDVHTHMLVYTSKPSNFKKFTVYFIKKINLSTY